ncbi:MAG: hypothetical protein AAFO58_04600 [Pseudomonadota bacterium]
MTRAMPVMIGLAMGLMIPFVVHGNGAVGGALFLIAHLLVLLAVLLLLRFVPRIGRVLRTHRPSPAHMARMALGAAAGFAVICLSCTFFFGMPHPWT